MLSVAQIGRYDDFFDLGGHSLLLLRVRDSLQRQGIDASLLDLMRHSTVASLAAVARSGSAQSEADAVVIRERGEATPLFLVHDGVGSLLYAHKLERFIDQRIPIYGLARPASETQPDSMAAFARALIPAMRSVQPKGPYRLAGWSFGGVVAYEIAVQLSAAGEAVEFVGLLDTYYRLPDTASLPSDATDIDYLLRMIEEERAAAGHSTKPPAGVLRDTAVGRSGMTGFSNFAVHSHFSAKAPVS